MAPNEQGHHIQKLLGKVMELESWIIACSVQIRWFLAVQKASISKLVFVSIRFHPKKNTRLLAVVSRAQSCSIVSGRRTFHRASWRASVLPQLLFVPIFTDTAVRQHDSWCKRPSQLTYLSFWDSWLTFPKLQRQRNLVEMCSYSLGLGWIFYDISQLVDGRGLFYSIRNAVKCRSRYSTKPWWIVHVFNRHPFHCKFQGLWFTPSSWVVVNIL